MQENKESRQRSKEQKKTKKKVKSSQPIARPDAEEILADLREAKAEQAALEREMNQHPR